MRNGLSEKGRELLRTVRSGKKELRHDITINGLFYALHLSDKYKLVERLTPVNLG
jgi:hypothetical protein